jgi:hypothetical protein
MLLFKSIAPILLGGLLFVCAQAEPVPPPLTADVTFRCLW